MVGGATLIGQNFAQMKLHGEGGESESRGHRSVMVIKRPKQ
jgi:hypothetical protein